MPSNHGYLIWTLVKDAKWRLEQCIQNAADRYEFQLSQLCERMKNLENDC